MADDRATRDSLRRHSTQRTLTHRADVLAHIAKIWDARAHLSVTALICRALRTDDKTLVAFGSLEEIDDVRLVEALSAYAHLAEEPTNPGAPRR